MAVRSDITLQVKRERQLRQNEALLNAIMIGATDYVLISLDRQGCITSCSKSVRAVTGFTVEALIGHPYSMFSAADATTPEGLVDRLREAEGHACPPSGQRLLPLIMHPVIVWQSTDRNDSAGTVVGDCDEKR